MTVVNRAAPIRGLVGSYTDRLPHVDGHGLGVISFILHDASIEITGPALELDDPSWLVVTASGEFAYAVSENAADEEGEGHVSALALDDAGRATLLNTVPTGGSAPAHLALDASERFLLVANYGGSSVSVFELAGGEVGPMTSITRHSGRSVNQERQFRPFPHQVVVDGESSRVFVPDLGLDAVFEYELDDLGLMREVKRFLVPAGSGPRHLAIHPAGRYLFVLGELNSSVTVVSRDSRDSTVVTSVSTLPAGASGTNLAAGLVLTRSGRYLFASNRGHDSIAMFRVTDAGAGLKLVDVVPSRGNTPRALQLARDDGRLLVANQDSDTVEVFDIAETGLRHAASLTLGSPACIAFL